MTPYRTRILAEGNSAPWSRAGTGERWFYGFGLLIDAAAEQMRQGTLAHIPLIRNPVDRSQVLWIPPADALAQKGDDMQIPRGLTESDSSYAFRLHIALDSDRHGGTTWAVLAQVLGYLLSLNPVARFVASRYDPATYPPTLVSTQWDSYPLNRRPYVISGGDVKQVEPEHVYALAGGDGEWDWDSASQITGSWGWYEGYLILYAVAPNAFVTPAGDWGEGSAYTPSADGYYSTVTAGAYVLAGSYTGTSQLFGVGSVYTAAASGYYSTVGNGLYRLAGSYIGVTQAWGVLETTNIGQSINIIAKQFKSANTWVRALIVSFDLALFSPTDPVNAGINPAGEMGQWSILDTGTPPSEYIDSRFTNAVYGDEVI